MSGMYFLFGFICATITYSQGKRKLVTVDEIAKIIRSNVIHIADSEPMYGVEKAAQIIYDLIWKEKKESSIV